MGISDPGHKAKIDVRIVREVVKSYTYVITWMAISIAVIMFNKVGGLHRLCVGLKRCLY